MCYYRSTVRSEDYYYEPVLRNRWADKALKTAGGTLCVLDTILREDVQT